MNNIPSKEVLSEHYKSHVPPVPAAVLCTLRKKAYAETLRIVLLRERVAQRNNRLAACGQHNPMLEYV